MILPLEELVTQLQIRLSPTERFEHKNRHLWWIALLVASWNEAGEEERMGIVQIMSAIQETALRGVFPDKWQAIWMGKNDDPTPE